MGELKLTFVNVGYGEAMVLECPDPAWPGGVFVMVIDGGSAEPEEYQNAASGRVPLDRYLARRGLDHIDLMAATHIHEDHLCGLLPVAERMLPGRFWQTLPPGFFRAMRPLDIPEGLNPSRRKFLHALNDYRHLCQDLDARGCPQLALAAGAEIPLCRGLTARVLGRSPARARQLEAMCLSLYQETDEAAFWRRLDHLDAAMNNFSLILRLEYQGIRILLPGDTNRMGYGGLAPADLRADLFKLGHHGQRDGISPGQIRIIAPRAVVCCASSDRRYNSAAPELLRMISDTGARLYFSDCPEVPDGIGAPPPHQALTIRLGGGLSPEITYDPLPG